MSGGNRWPGWHAGSSRRRSLRPCSGHVELPSRRGSRDQRPAARPGQAAVGPELGLPTRAAVRPEEGVQGPLGHPRLDHYGEAYSRQKQLPWERPGGRRQGHVRVQQRLV